MNLPLSATRQHRGGANVAPSQTGIPAAGARSPDLSASAGRRCRTCRHAPASPPSHAPHARADLPVYRGPFRRAQAERLLWRAGFGPRARARRSGSPSSGLDGRGARAHAPALAPPAAARRRRSTAAGWRRATSGATTCSGGSTAWSAREAPLVERMTLVWHDWFATSKAAVDARWMLRQNALLRRHALGNFRALLRDDHQGPGDADVAQRDREQPRGRRTRTTRASCRSCSRSAPAAATPSATCARWRAR